MGASAIRLVISEIAPNRNIRTIEQASIWPDCIKTLGDRFSYAYMWHFQDVDICKSFARPCHNAEALIERLSTVPVHPDLDDAAMREMAEIINRVTG